MDQSGSLSPSYLELELIQDTKVLSGLSSFFSFFLVLKVLEIPVTLPTERGKDTRSVQNCHVHGQNLRTLACKDRAGLVKWAEIWYIKEPKLLNDIKRAATSPQSSLISKEANSHLFEFYAKHIFSIPVNNVIAERQFNLSQLYLQNNMSELSKQASITFVENVLHSGKTNNRTTAAREVHEERMKTYANMLNSDLLQEARKKLNSIRKCENHGPLTAKDVYPKAWEARKLNSNTPCMIQSLKAKGRKLELQWKASTKGTSQLKNQRSFRPIVVTDLRTAGKVPSLMQLAATEVWGYGQELSIHDSPRECQFFVQTLPNIVQSLNIDVPSTLDMHTTQLPLQEE